LRSRPPARRRGDTWAPLAPGTLANKARKGQASDILHATGDLETAIMGGTGAVKRVTMTSARAGVNGRTIFYALFAQSGRGGDHPMPARPIMGIAPDTEAESFTMLREWLLGAA
jgi:phage gpG-like protein